MMICKQLCGFVLIMALVCGGIFPQEEAEEGSETPFFKSILEDQGKIWTSPFRLSTKTALQWGGIALLTGVLIANDEAIYKSFKDFQADNSWVDWWSPKITTMGDGGFNVGVSGLFYLSGLLFKDPKAKETAKLTLLTYIHTGLVVQLMKHLTGRQRPSVDEGKDHWHGPSGFFKRYSPYQLPKYDAFPSGHTISIWGTATVIAHMYNKSPLVPVICYSLATLTGLSRVTEDTHWLSDVVLGAALGFAIGKFVVKTRRSKKIQLLPTTAGNKPGLGLAICF